MKKKMKAHQIIALLGVVVLVGMYIVTLILGIINHNQATNLFKLSVFATFIIPIIIYVFLMFYKLSHKNDIPEEIVFADEKDDPFTEEDFKDDDTEA